MLREAGAAVDVFPNRNVEIPAIFAGNDIDLSVAIDIGDSDASSHDIRRDENAWPVSLAWIRRNLEIVCAKTTRQNDFRQPPRDNLTQRIAPALEGSGIGRDASNENRAPPCPTSV